MKVIVALFKKNWTFWASMKLKAKNLILIYYEKRTEIQVLQS